MLSTGTIGYQHDFQNSLLGSYYDHDQAYLSWTQLIWRFTGLPAPPVLRTCAIKA